MIEIPSIGSTLTCPKCNSEFKVSDETKYFAAGWTCSWKCFLNSLKPRILNNDEKSNTNITTNKKVEYTPSKVNLWDATIKRKRGRPKKK